MQTDKQPSEMVPEKITAAPDAIATPPPAVGETATASADDVIDPMKKMLVTAKLERAGRVLSSRIRAVWDAFASLSEVYHAEAPTARMSAYQSACLDTLNGMLPSFRDVVAFTLLCRSLQTVLDSGLFVAGNTAMEPWSYAVQVGEDGLLKRVKVYKDGGLYWAVRSNTAKDGVARVLDAMESVFDLARDVSGDLRETAEIVSFLNVVRNIAEDLAYITPSERLPMSSRSSTASSESGAGPS